MRINVELGELYIHGYQVGELVRHRHLPGVFLVLTILRSGLAELLDSSGQTFVAQIPHFIFVEISNEY
jgi:hypothetical protein